MAFSTAVLLMTLTIFTLVIIDAAAKSLHHHKHHHHHHHHRKSASRLIPRLTDDDLRNFDLDEEMWRDVEKSHHKMPKRQGYTTDELAQYEDCAACRYHVTPVETSEDYHVPEGLVEVTCKHGDTNPCTEKGTEGTWDCVQTISNIQFEGKNGKGSFTRPIKTGCVCALVNYDVAQAFTRSVENLRE